MEKQEESLGNPMVTVTVRCGSVADRDELDFVSHYAHKSKDVVKKVTENGEVVGFTYLLRDFDHLGIANLAARALGRLTFDGVQVQTEVVFEEDIPEVKGKKVAAKDKRGGGSRLF